VFSRAFHLTAISLWLVMGGDRLAIEGLGATVEMLPLDGTLSLSAGLAHTAVSVSAEMLLVAIQVTIPAFAALMVAEVGLGVASRFAPQANVFALGLPLKLIAALATVGLVVAGFPSAVSGAMDSTREIIVTTIRGLGG
jgi:flagellar biosynthetic protein FliR